MIKERMNIVGNLDTADSQKEELNEKRLKNFSLILSRRGEAEKLNINEMMEGFVADLPTRLQKDLISTFERLRAKGLQGDDLKEEIIETRRILKSAYKDKRFEVGNKEYAKLQVVKMLAELFEENFVGQNDLKRIARISFDLNGLKAVNDLTGSHEKGNRYLELMLNTLRGEKATAWLTERKMDFVITADGGDEFGVVLRSENAINEDEVYEEFISKIIKNELWESEMAREILDFDKDEVVLAYFGIDKNTWQSKTETEKKAILNEARKDIPDGYFFRAAVSGDVTTLYHSIVHAKIKTRGSYENMLEDVMGSLFDDSDRKMQDDKVAFKANLARSQNPHENFLLKVYSRTDNEKELRSIIDAYGLFLRNVEQAVTSDSMSVMPKIIEDVKKQIMEIKQRTKDKK